MKTRLALLVLMAVPASMACGSGEAADAPVAQTSPVERQDLRLVAEATGLVEPIRTVEVKSKASGEILRLHVDVGDRVEPGFLLAEVDPRDVRNAFEQARADLEVAQARVQIAESQLRRSSELLAAGVVTEQEHEGTNLESANARAALQRAQTNLELAELRLTDVTIRAPMAGVILAKNVEEGVVIQSASGNVSGGTTLFTMANLDDMQVRTLVDETDMGQLRAGMAATVRVEAFQDRIFQGEVEKIEPQATVQQNVTMFPVIVQLNNREGLLKPGMNAEVEILIDERRGVLTVPNGSLVEFQEMAPAAMVLGLDPEAIRMDRSVFAVLRQGGSASGAPSPAAAPGGSPGGTAAEAAGGAPVEGRRARMDSLRARVARGEISEDSLQSLMSRSRGQGGGPPGALANGSAGVEAVATGDAVQVGTSLEAARTAIAFVVKGDGSMEPRPVLIGINDWDRTEIVAGLQDGEQVALIGAAQLQAQQQEFMDRMRARRPGGPF